MWALLKHPHLVKHCAWVSARLWFIFDKVYMASVILPCGGTQFNYSTQHNYIIASGSPPTVFGSYCNIISQGYFYSRCSVDCCDLYIYLHLCGISNCLAYTLPRLLHDFQESTCVYYLKYQLGEYHGLLYRYHLCMPFHVQYNNNHTFGCP